MTTLRKIVLEGNVNLKAIKLQQDTCAGYQPTLTIDFAGMQSLRIDAPRRLRSRIIVNGRNALELHPQVTVPPGRDNKIEIVEWPSPIIKFELAESSDGWVRTKQWGKAHRLDTGEFEIQWIFALLPVVKSNMLRLLNYTILGCLCRGSTIIHLIISVLAQKNTILH